MTEISKNNISVWKETPVIWFSFAVVVLLLGFIYWEGLKELVKVWDTKEEYSYGYMIPFISLFLLWQKKDEIEKIDFESSWTGLVIVVIGFLLFVLGNLSTLFLVVQYSMLVVIVGIVLAYTGWRGFKVIAVPFLFLAFMIPLPQFFFVNLSTSLQFVSSDIGVWVIRLFGISVFLEGNVIDLGSMKLQVVEACSGLRYLFPLMTLGFMAAYFFKAALWKRALVFLSTIPITVLMNSFRIGLIGVTVEYWGKEMAEGFLHDFEGWAVFMACTSVLVGEMWLLSRIGKNRLPLREVFGLELPAHTPVDAQVNARTLPKSYLAAVVVVVVVAVIAHFIPDRVEVSPQRKTFAEFPAEIGKWKGKDERLEQIYLDKLKLDDYLLVDFAEEPGKQINFYVAYYASQRKGESAHSPRTCVPGGGWEMSGLADFVVENVTVNGHPLVVNRAVIQMGEQKQVMYYWFQQRGRVITNEYLVKWFIFWDALTRNRTDGALIRLVAPVMPGEDVAVADNRIQKFIQEVSSKLSDFVPD